MFPRAADLVDVPYEASDFPIASPLNTKGKMSVRWDEILWASITVGKAERDVAGFGSYSMAEMMHRVSCFNAYYLIDAGRLTLSPAFKNLDPTEKGIVSFYTGMAMAKLYADKVLGVPWLMHISRYETAWAVKYGARTDRPDLFGCDRFGNWVVAEAKGRSRVTGQLLKKMKDQKSAVATINGSPPVHRYGSATRVEARRVALRVVDPPARRRAADVELDSAAWLVDYYGPIVELIQTTERRSEGEFTFGRLPGSAIEVGVANDTIRVIQESRERTFVRPSHPARLRKGVEISDGRPLMDQAAPGNRDIVDRLLASAERARDFRESPQDGVIVRSARN